MIKPSQAIAFRFGTQTPATGAAVNADSTPTVVVYKNGAVDVAVTPTVTNPATGSYKVEFTVPSDYAAGDIVEVLATATVATVASPPTSVFLDSVDTVRDSETYARIGAAGAGLTALGDTRIANLDATVSSRLASASYTAPDNTTIGTISTALTALAAKFVGITFVANWLRLLGRKDAANATAKTEFNNGGGGYDEATDSLEAQADAALAIKTKTDNLPSDPADESIVLAAIAEINTGAGAGSVPFTDIVDDGVDPLDNVKVWATTDSAGAHVYGSTQTTADGSFTLHLDPATTTYYLWFELGGCNFTNPTTLTYNSGSGEFE